MQLVILAAGKGTRMEPITHKIPKPMVPLCGKPSGRAGKPSGRAGKPKLQWTLENLPKEIDKVLITINHLGKQIEDHFGDEFCGRQIEYVFQEKLDGTGGALHACREKLDERFLVMMGDDLYVPGDIAKMAKEQLAILALDAKGEEALGMIFVDKHGNYKGIMEKGQGEELGKLYPKKMICTGLYGLDKRFFDYPLAAISEKEFGLPQTMVSVTADHDIKVVEAQDWMAVGTVSDIKKAEKELNRFFGNDE